MLALAIGGEYARHSAAVAGPAMGWWSGVSPDWLPFLPLLAAAIPAWFLHTSHLPRAPRWWLRVGRWGSETCPTATRPATRSEASRAVGLSLLVAGAGWLMSAYVGRQFGDLPPAYHDEFSHLFQARTFLAGRVSFPSHPQLPELFDQMHVLNEGRFASRYFPGVGLWIAPFLALGNAWWGHRVAHSCAAFLLFWIGRHLADNAAGLLAGLLLALSPGVALFSNLLLAHHPTLVGLLVFVITFLKLRRATVAGGRTWVWALLAGCGLTFAMLCRPMTAAGVGLPFGLWFGWWVLTGRQASTNLREASGETATLRTRLQTTAAMVLPIAIGFAGLFAYDRAITGHALLTPYQQYTAIYTPRHVYGFNNVRRGERRLGPKVLENYDRWAENLTPSLAARNVWRRVISSFRWTLGIVPLAFVGLISLFTIYRWNGDWQLMGAAIVSLHAVHVPYWFEGIMGWHYVFESAPFWLLLVAGATRKLSGHWRAAGRGGMPWWWGLLLVAAVTVNLVTVEPLWPSRLAVGIAEVRFPRQKYAAFFQAMEHLTGDRRALVLVQGDPADRHMDYVVNRPQLNARILYGRYRPGETLLSDVVRAFPDRDVWWVDVASGEVRQVSGAAEL